MTSEQPPKKSGRISKPTRPQQSTTAHSKKPSRVGRAQHTDQSTTGHPKKSSRVGRVPHTDQSTTEHPKNPSRAGRTQHTRHSTTEQPPKLTRHGRTQRAHQDTNVAPSNERLQKILSQVGLGSRREMERWIEEGVIQVNGVVAKIGDSATAKDVITVRGKVISNPLATKQRTRILLYHKPVGEISSRQDPKFPQTVFDNLPRLKVGRWVQVGRLDLNTSGLLIFTNDGELANRLMHPKFELEREYAVRVHGRVSPEIIKNFQRGVMLDDGMAKFKRIESRGGEGANSWYHVVLSEGKNREVRRMWESQGLEVSRLIRIRYGSLLMPRFLSRGDYLELSREEVEVFLKNL